MSRSRAAGPRAPRCRTPSAPGSGGAGTARRARRCPRRRADGLGLRRGWPRADHPTAHRPPTITAATRSSAPMSTTDRRGRPAGRRRDRCGAGPCGRRSRSTGRRPRWPMRGRRSPGRRSPAARPPRGAGPRAPWAARCPRPFRRSARLRPRCRSATTRILARRPSSGVRPARASNATNGGGGGTPGSAPRVGQTATCRRASASTTSAVTRSPDSVRQAQCSTPSAPAATACSTAASAWPWTSPAARPRAPPRRRAAAPPG